MIDAKHWTALQLAISVFLISMLHFSHKVLNITSCIVSHKSSGIYIWNCFIANHDLCNFHERIYSQIQQLYKCNTTLLLSHVAQYNKTSDVPYKTTQHYCYVSLSWHPLFSLYTLINTWFQTFQCKT